MSDAPDNGQPTTPGSPGGAYTLAEILSQPSCWEVSLRVLGETGALDKLARQFAGAEEWIFIGCGSSYYVAQSAAATMASLTGLRAQAVAASELLLFPEIVLAAKSRRVPVLISRSGRTSEVLRVAQLLRERRIATLGISCAPGQALERLVSSALVLPAADEQSTVMTRSFTSMLLALQTLAATIGGRQDFLSARGALAKGAEELLQTLPQRVREFVSTHEFEDYVCLGQGPLHGIACESALKLTEMSVSYGQSFQTGYAAELDVLEEVKQLGGTTLVVANRADQRARSAADLLVELAIDGPEPARTALYVLAGQLVGLYTGIEKGLNPDKPRNLSRVVVLEKQGSPEQSKHVAI